MDIKNLSVIGLMICIVVISGCTTQPNNQDPLERACIASGGTVTTQNCCGSAGDFPNTCTIGACGCSPENSKQVKFCDCGGGSCFNGSACSRIPNVIVTTFEECVAAGYPIMKSNPPQCMTPDGQIFIEELKDPMEQLCNDSGGNWNICSNKCMLDNQGKDGIACTMMCEALCECGGIAGFRCPNGYSCMIKSNAADALGYCEAEAIGGQRDEHGCLGPAGYSWDSDIGACIRSWELDESKKKAAKIAIAPLSYPVIITSVEDLNCPGCFIVHIQRTDNQINLEMELANWTVVLLKKSTPPVDNSLIDNQTCISDSSGRSMGLTEALDIASTSKCAQNGTLTDRHNCNSFTGTWWIDLELNRPGCSPACVVNVDNKTAEINWRCTGALLE